jgi:hypothetical protein
LIQAVVSAFDLQESGDACRSARRITPDVADHHSHGNPPVPRREAFAQLEADLTREMFVGEK